MVKCMFVCCVYLAGGLLVCGQLWVVWIGGIQFLSLFRLSFFCGVETWNFDAMIHFQSKLKIGHFQRLGTSVVSTQYSTLCHTMDEIIQQVEQNKFHFAFQFNITGWVNLSHHTLQLLHGCFQHCGCIDVFWQDWW